MRLSILAFIFIAHVAHAETVNRPVLNCFQYRPNANVGISATISETYATHSGRTSFYTLAGAHHKPGGYIPLAKERVRYSTESSPSNETPRIFSGRWASLVVFQRPNKPYPAVFQFSHGETITTIPLWCEDRR